MNGPYMGHASHLLDLHKECLERFKAVILSQQLVGGRKFLSLFIEVPVYYVRRRRRPRNVKRREKDRKRREEKKRSKEGSPPSPSPPNSLPLPSQTRQLAGLI